MLAGLYLHDCLEMLLAGWRPWPCPPPAGPVPVTLAGLTPETSLLASRNYLTPASSHNSTWDQGAQRSLLAVCLAVGVEDALKRELTVAGSSVCPERFGLCGFRVLTCGSDLPKSLCLQLASASPISFPFLSLLATGI